MTLTRIVTVLIFAVMAADYSHGCNQDKLLQCSQKYLEFFNTTSSTNDVKLICRSDVITYGKCVLEEGQACGMLNKYNSSLGYSSWTELEKICALLGQPISQNAAKQTLPSAMTILGLLTVLFIRTFLDWRQGMST
ncbi:hypothetical protein ACJMK2_035571 [Sinanodonta woodiana]|uniref:Uncharacterized protein n=1 Tax=Sinanodonta woodiana TaxID=1069815 RepID=A0ABD3WZE2_SINWO